MKLLTTTAYLLILFSCLVSSLGEKVRGSRVQGETTEVQQQQEQEQEQEQQQQQRRLPGCSLTRVRLVAKIDSSPSDNSLVMYDITTPGTKYIDTQSLSSGRNVFTECRDMATECHIAELKDSMCDGIGANGFISYSLNGIRQARIPGDKIACSYTFRIGKCPKIEWPELLYTAAASAEITIKSENPAVTLVVVVRPGEFVNSMYRTDRVVLYVDVNDIVNQIPVIG